MNDQEEFDYADFVSEEKTVPEEKVGKYNLPFMIFPSVFLFIYVINFSAADFTVGLDQFITVQNLFLVFAGGFLAHELLHLVAWRFMSGYPFRRFRMGMRWHSFTPVITCMRPMPINAFRVGVLFPFFVMGVLPLAFAFYLNEPWLLFAAVIYMAWASADILTFILLWTYSSRTFVEMHSSKLGIIVFNPKEKPEELIPS